MVRTNDVFPSPENPTTITLKCDTIGFLDRGVMNDVGVKKCERERERSKRKIGEPSE